MKKFIINNSMNMIKKYNPELNETKLKEIEYGLLSLYLTFSKIFIILILSFILNIFREVVIFLFVYNIIRMPSFGLHATKSWMCLVSSTIIFIGCPYLCNIITINTTIRFLIGIVCVLLMFLHSPADTHKRPIVNPKRRLVYKLLSTLTASIFVMISLFTKDNFLANTFIISLVVQCFMISPLIYRLFKLPYNNYKNYVLKYS